MIRRHAEIQTCCGSLVTKEEMIEELSFPVDRRATDLAVALESF